MKWKLLIGTYLAFALILFMPFTLCLAAERDVQLQWEPSIDAQYIQSYKIYYYTTSGDVSSLSTADYATSYTVGGITHSIDPSGPKAITIDKTYTELTFHFPDDSKEYYFVITSIDDSNLESDYSTEYMIAAHVSNNSTTVASGDSGSSGGGGCFIATAAFGSYLDPHVYALRQFRDRVLLKNYIGTAFVKFYYKHSPPVADYIRQHDRLRMITRWALTPLIFGVQYPRITLVLIIAMVAAIIGCRRRRRSRGSRVPGFEGSRA